ncbi:cell division protein ZapB [Salipiger sp.]|uniref:cell division protein ZapB n=1 Tax=Salipiger sp. TaxID=2078585 RepID=UPI003A97140C
MSDVMMKALQMQNESLTRQVEQLGPENERVRRILTEFDARHDADQARITALEAQLAARRVVVRPLPMSSAPKDGTMLRLLVRYDQDNWFPLEDSAEAWTIGFNALDDTGEDVWQMAGWNWEHDCFTAGGGTVIGWLPFHDQSLDSDTLPCQICERPVLVDATVSNEDWAKISPTGDEGGYLCAACVAERMCDLHGWPAVSVVSSQPTTAAEAAKVMLACYDKDMSGTKPTEAEREVALAVALASSFAAYAYEQGMPGGQNAHALARSFLLALIDPLHPDLDYLRADPPSGQTARDARAARRAIGEGK